MFRGSFVAVVTPFTDTDTIDFVAFEKLIEWHIQEGTQGLIIAGTVGENTSLTFEEKVSLFQKAADIAKNRILLIGSTGCSSTREAALLTRRAKEIGLDGAIVISPYGNRPGEEGHLAHYRAIAEIGLPIILYYNPIRTGLRLTPEQIEKVCGIPNVVAVKDASGDVSFSTELKHRLKHTALFSGDDGLALAHLSMGYDGVISTVGNLIPRQWSDFVRAPTAEQFFALYDLCRLTVCETNPQVVKYALSVMGKCKAHIRLPLVLPQPTTRAKIEVYLKSLQEKQELLPLRS
jgi:4-hydroxy-tetrahydrodipicolinate synthase